LDSGGAWFEYSSRHLLNLLKCILFLVSPSRLVLADFYRGRLHRLPINLQEIPSHGQENFEKHHKVSKPYVIIMINYRNFINAHLNYIA